ncbi:unnamed protein product [Phytomonas sp. EM1]|nr:unnamed protein product [Phytomonas sp. EM1]|eukprot:CCW61095.1 unnamed protein product [Phytomonas sp. isolate EM1]
MASQELLSIPFAEASVGSPSPCGDPSSVVRIAKGTPRPASPKPDQGDLAGVKKNVSRRLLLLPRVVRRIEGAALRDPVEGHGASRKGVRRSNAKPPAGTEKEKEKNDAEEHKPSVLEAHPRRPPLQRLGAELRQWRASLHEFKHRLHHQEERGGGEINGDEAGGEPSKIMESSASLLNYGNSTFSSTMYTQELHSLTEGDLYRSVNDYNGNVVKITDASFKEKIRMFQVNGEQPKYFVVFCIPKRERRLVFLQGAKWNFSLLRHMIRMEIHPVSGTMAKTV